MTTVVTKITITDRSSSNNESNSKQVEFFWQLRWKDVFKVLWKEIMQDWLLLVVISFPTRKKKLFLFYQMFNDNNWQFCDFWSDNYYSSIYFSIRKGEKMSSFCFALIWERKLMQLFVFEQISRNSRQKKHFIYY